MRRRPRQCWLPQSRPLRSCSLSRRMPQARVCERRWVGIPGRCLSQACSPWWLGPIWVLSGSPTCSRYLRSTRQSVLAAACWRWQRRIPSTRRRRAQPGCSRARVRLGAHHFRRHGYRHAHGAAPCLPIAHDEFVLDRGCLISCPDRSGRLTKAFGVNPRSAGKPPDSFMTQPGTKAAARNSASGAQAGLSPRANLEASRWPTPRSMTLARLRGASSRFLLRPGTISRIAPWTRGRPK